MTASDLEKFALRFRSLCQGSGLSDAEIARSVGVSPQVFSNWKRGENKPRVETAAKLAGALGTSVDHILTGASYTATPVEVAVGGLRKVVKLNTSEAIGEAPWRLTDRPMIAVHFDCGPHAVALAIEDRSNSDRFLPGDGVIIDPDLLPKPGDMVLVRRNGVGYFRK